MLELLQPLPELRWAATHHRLIAEGELYRVAKPIRGRIGTHAVAREAPKLPQS